MRDLPFPYVTILTDCPAVTQNVSSVVEAAEWLVLYWPDHKGEKLMAARQACQDALRVGPRAYRLDRRLSTPREKLASILGKNTSSSTVLLAGLCSKTSPGRDRLHWRTPGVRQRRKPAHHRIRCRTIKNSQTVTMTAMAPSAYIVKLVENRSAEMVVMYAASISDGAKPGRIIFREK